MMRKQYQEGGIIDWFMSLFSDDDPKAAAAKTPRLPGKYKISDLRKMSGTTGRAIDPRSELVTGQYDGERMENIIKAAKRYNMDPYTALAIDLQETGLGNRSEGRMGHSLLNFNELIPTKMGSEEEADDYDRYVRAIATKMQYADKLGIKDPLVRLQAYNGLGKIFPETEQNYHGFKMKKIYGVPVPKTGIDMRKNPLYGKRVSDIRDNVLRKDKNLDAYIRSIKQKGGAVVSPYGQWKYPGKDTIVPTSTGKITMKGVPYPVYGKDETGYGQMMYPDGEYRFPGNMVYEKPMVRRTGDSTLENIAEVFDPTGITSWDDVYRSYKETGWSPDTALEIFGALPMLGKVGKAGKWLGEVGKAVAVTARQKNNVKTFSKALQSVPYIGRATDAYQTIQQAPDAPITPFGKGGQHGGLDRWFAEKWVDIKTGKECGRDEGEKRGSYPACRPSRRVSADTPKTASELSSAEREKFKRSKTSSERINYQHRRMQDGGEQTESDMANKPNNPALWSRAKSLAKQKFDVYPSAYANGWAAKWYKGKGGTWSKAEYGMEMMAEGGTNNPGFKALPEFVQAKILSNMGYGGYYNPMMAEGGEPNGEMALGQMAAVEDKMRKLLQFVKPNDNLDPWIASKLAVMDHSADAISDYLMYGPDAEQMEQEMKKGGYVVTRSNDRKGKTHKVTGPDGTVKYFGDAKLGQHPRDPERKKAFYARHKKNLEGNPYFRAFARATWQDGGETAAYKPLSKEELSALAHQFRGSGSGKDSYVLNYDNIKNTLGYLTPREKKQLEEYMQSSSGLDQFWQMLPNLRGNSGAAGLPANSRLMESTMRSSYMPGPNGYSDWLRYMESKGYKEGGYIGYDGKRHMSSTPTWSGNMGYQTGGEPVWHSNWNQDEASYYESADPMMEQFSQDVAAMPAAAVAMNLPGSQEAKQAAPSSAPRQSSGVSVVDYMNKVGMPSDYATRKALAEERGIKGYRGTAEQNMMLLSKIKQEVQTAADAAAYQSYNKSNSNMLRKGYTAPSNPFIFGEMPQRPAVNTPGAAKAAAAKQVNAANAQDAEDARSFAKYKAEDPYFFAEESDPSWVKAIDMPFTYLRDMGAQVILDQDLMALGQLLALGAGSRAIKGKTKIEPYYGGQKALPRMPGKSLPAPAAPGPRGPIPGPASGGYIKPRVPGQSPRGFQIPDAGLRSPGYPRFAQGGPAVGEEMEVTPEQLEQLRAQGYQFEII